jgi:hypothetical protein
MFPRPLAEVNPLASVVLLRADTKPWHCDLAPIRRTPLCAAMRLDSALTGVLYPIDACVRVIVEPFDPIDDVELGQRTSVVAAIKGVRH